MPASYEDTVLYLTEKATSGDLTRFVAALRNRSKALEAARAGAAAVGQTVRLGQLRSYELNGLRGTVRSIDGTRRGRHTANVELDAESTARYRRLRSLDGNGPHTVEVPVVCLFPLSAPRMSAASLTGDATADAIVAYISGTATHDEVEAIMWLARERQRLLTAARAAFSLTSPAVTLTGIEKSFEGLTGEIRTIEWKAKPRVTLALDAASLDAVETRPGARDHVVAGLVDGIPLTTCVPR